jgi:hypothetical protein
LQTAHPKGRGSIEHFSRGVYHIDGSENNREKTVTVPADIEPYLDYRFWVLPGE